VAKRVASQIPVHNEQIMQIAMFCLWVAGSRVGRQGRWERRLISASAKWQTTEFKQWSPNVAAKQMSCGSKLADIYKYPSTYAL
jgi:hypothetical protein